MESCEQCGSSSRDKDGFCHGCGASWPLELPAPNEKMEAKPSHSRPGRRSQVAGEIGPIDA